MYSDWNGLRGWTESKLPDFEKLQSKWNKRYAGMTETPEHFEPATQAKIWDVLERLANLRQASDVLYDLKNKNSNS
jgi:hypothetical protein